MVCINLGVSSIRRHIERTDYPTATTARRSCTYSASLCRLGSPWIPVGISVTAARKIPTWVLSFHNCSISSTSLPYLCTTTMRNPPSRRLPTSPPFISRSSNKADRAFIQSLPSKATDLEVLRILLSIGGVEIDHFSLWHDKMGNAVAQPVAPFSDPVTGLTFSDFNDPADQHNAKHSTADQQAGSQMFQTNLIQPEPCQFISPDLPPCSIIRPTLSPKRRSHGNGTGVSCNNSWTWRLRPRRRAACGAAQCPPR